MSPGFRFLANLNPSVPHVVKQLAIQKCFKTLFGFLMIEWYSIPLCTALFSHILTWFFDFMFKVFCFVFFFNRL
jgi:hypothetical protein